jgi:hypothetical protein
MAQRLSGKSCTQGTPAGLPCGIPGMGLVIEGAIQQAPQSGRQLITLLKSLLFCIVTKRRRLRGHTLLHDH